MHKCLQMVFEFLSSSCQLIRPLSGYWSEYDKVAIFDYIYIFFKLRSFRHFAFIALREIEQGVYASNREANPVLWHPKQCLCQRAMPADDFFYIILKLYLSIICLNDLSS